MCESGGGCNEGGNGKPHKFSAIFSLNAVKALYIAKNTKGPTDTNIAKAFFFC